MFCATSTYKDYIASSLVRKPLSRIKVDNKEYTALKEYPKVEHSTESLLGTFPSKTCEFEIYDIENELSLVGKNVEVYRGLKLPSGNEWIPMGVFKAMASDISADTSKKTVKFKGYDKATAFDIGFNPENHTYPCTLSQFVHRLCQNHSVELESTTFPMSDLVLSAQPEFDEGVTERELISKAAELGGATAQITREGKLRISKPTSTGMTLSSAKYKSFSQKKSVYITTLILREDGSDDVVKKDTTYVGAYGEKVYTIKNNPFIKGRLTEKADRIAENILNMNVTPFEMIETVDDFIFDLNDDVTVMTRNGEKIKTTLLSISTQGRIKSTLKAEPSEEKTLVQGSIRQQLENVSEKLSQTHSYAQATEKSYESFLNTLKDGLDKGLYQTTKQSADGSSVTYYHDTPNIEDATYIQIFTSTGRAWTQGSGCWNGGEPVWKYGENKDGDAVLRDLLVRTLTADLIRAGKLSSFDGETYFDLDNNEICTHGSGKTIDKLNEDNIDLKAKYKSGNLEITATSKETGETLYAMTLSPQLSKIETSYEPDGAIDQWLNGTFMFKSTKGTGVFGSTGAYLTDPDNLIAINAYYRHDGAYAPDFTIAKWLEKTDENGSVTYTDLSIKEALKDLATNLQPQDFSDSVTYASDQTPAHSSFYIVSTTGRVDVYYQGSIAQHSTGDLLFTIPKEYAPKRQTFFSFVKNAVAYGTVRFETDGNVYVGFISSTSANGRIYFNAGYYI